jgi:thiopeptide-type bacteriocin biosynthesis protein
MRYDIAQQLLLRMPVKNPIDYARQPQYFLNDQFFLAAMRVATPAFYALLKSRQFHANELSAKEVHTLQKYINRYCFRPTPFGLFASVTLVEWSNYLISTSSPPTFEAFIRTAMPLQNQLSKYLLTQGQISGTLYESNPSIYRVLNEYRFFRTGLDEIGKQRDYQLQSIAFSKVLKDLLSLCDSGKPYQAIVDQIAISASCSVAEAIDYAGFLIDSQLLLNGDRLSISGDDPLAALAAKLKEGEMKQAIIQTLQKQQGETGAITPGVIDDLEVDVDKLIPGQEIDSDKLSIILKRADIEEGPDIKYQEQIRNGIKALALLSATGLSATMAKFIESFQQHFEGQTLPLLQALDPEAGVGYQQPETEKNNPLLETLNIPNRSQQKPGGSWSPAHRLLLESWLRDKSADPVIRLEKEDLDQLKNLGTPDPLLGMSVLFRVSNDHIFIENAGGINAPALLGRFTVADENIAAAAQAMARKLENLNQETIFAELLHLADPHTDNVNRRAHIYRYELPITAASSLPRTRQLQLSDLYIKIIDHKAMLFSAKHQKFVVPRLTSAYNHSLNKLPLFRFLADLPYQYGPSNLSLDLRQLFPGLSFYPRVVYKGAILSLATWVVTEQQIYQLNDPKNGTKYFQALSKTIRLPRYFSLAEGDQELVFDSQHNAEVRFFLNCASQKKELILKEYLEQHEIKQYNAYLLPTDSLALPKAVKMTSHKNNVQRKYMPGSQWLYLKIYGPKIGANRLLLRIAPLLKKRYGQHQISQWFFIRYEDHAPHIRLRLKVSPEMISELLLAFKTKLEDPIQQHVIREFQVDVYNRELERYAAGGIENTERFFWASSELVIHYLKRSMAQPIVSTHAFAIYSTHHIISSSIADADEQIAFTLSSFQQFLLEFADKPLKFELDKKYRALAADIQAAFSETDPSLLTGSLKAGINFSQSLQLIQTHLATEQTDYLRSIIHVHLNRIFTDESRKQEMICYYLLHKYLLSVKGRNKHSR